jgi:ketosteroid isomerase-like protein
VLDELMALWMKVDEAYNKNDAAALAALFTEDALYVAPEEGCLAVSLAVGRP